MKKLVYLVMIAIAVLAFWEESRPVEKINLQVAVHSGDTLWTMVGNAMDKVGDRRDIRLVIDDTIKLNNLRGMAGKLRVGDVVNIPLGGAKMMDEARQKLFAEALEHLDAAAKLLGEITNRSEVNFPVIGLSYDINNKDVIKIQLGTSEPKCFEKEAIRMEFSDMYDQLLWQKGNLVFMKLIDKEGSKEA